MYSLEIFFVSQYVKVVFIKAKIDKKEIQILACSSIL